jgi:glycosyltransferase involved in cell wall biosynthesis
LGLDPSRRWVLFGALPANAVKNHPRFLRVLEAVRAHVPEAEPLVLSAMGQPYERVVDKLNAADVLLFTSERGHEGSPTVIKEALAVNLPVVSVDAGDAREMLDGVAPGTVVDWPAGPDGEAALDRELARGVLAVLAEGRRSDGRERREFLRQEAVARRTLDVYREVLAERGR